MKKLLRYPAERKATTYSIPETVTSIDSCAFEPTNHLVTVRI